MDTINLGAIKKETTYQAAYKQLKEAILTGRLTSGRYYTEVELATVLDISRTPVREAVKDLIHDNLLVAVPRKGMKIKDFTKIEIEQVFLLRKAIETEVLNKFMKAVADEQVDELNELIKLQKQALIDKDKITFIHLDQKFHNRIFSFTNYELIEEIFVRLHNLTRLIGHKALLKGGRMEEVIIEHRDIVEAIEKRDAALAKEKLIRHLDETEKSLWTINHKGE
ncbi:GntR family transcriptional regulator [Scopulibacillus darangshiensis]|uniref:GntR family transcriptional regulator n=1 Tax=Scopulibacillus darangshiensis TaxID=442528 RepID=A0A4R2NIQ6_9BACL|nr:GntR family transcriptional regulator [Scopulibacillus darangshiensis]TCP21172.1 GntR family transcriptional regulator [Scopulibacillus darangshiensis]